MYGIVLFRFVSKIKKKTLDWYRFIKRNKDILMISIRIYSFGSNLSAKQ